MSAFGHRLRNVATVLMLVLVTFGASATQAQTVTLTRDIDLVADAGLVHYSQTDGRWAYFPVRGDNTINIGRCGCLLSAFATVINQEGGMVPWFPTPFDFFGGYNGAFNFNPRYLDLFLTYGPNPSGAPGGGPAFPAGWGYKPQPAGTCGVIPFLQALQAVGRDFAGPQPLGFTPVVHDGFGPDAMDIVNRNLLAGRPTIVAVRKGNSSVANHAVLIAGWDASDGEYRILDPMTPRAGLHGLNRPEQPLDIDPNDPPNTAATYAKWRGRVAGVIEMRRGSSSLNQPSFMFGDDPSPIDILMIGPDGRRTGIDAAGTKYAENDRASYWTWGPWLDPLGEAPEGDAPRFIMYPSAPSGTYHFIVNGTANGPLDLSAETLVGGRRTLLGEFRGTIALGETRKYELQFGGTGTSTVAQVDNFTPHAYAGDDFNARTDTPVTFDGRRSFDADGVIASYAWDFGDGLSGTGAQPQHVYALPGDYTVTLTVTDEDGVSVTDELRVNVILSQRRPVADASGPYLGFASPDGEFYVLLDARGSSDPNGDPLTYRWDFGDGSPVRTTSTPFVDHVYTELGVYTMTVIANDGLDDSAPATARVDIVTAPTSPPFGAIDAFLTPTCGAPGSQVTITMGEFAQFDSWNYATMGALPRFPPLRLPLGLSPPDGMVDLRLPGGEREYVPFTATLLSPGRYIARATFTVPDLPDGVYQVGWSEDGRLPFRVSCPVPENRPPVADAGGPYTGQVGSAIEFDGGGSTDDGDFLFYAWDFGDGTSGEGERPSHVYEHPGRYIVTLLVNDDEGTWWIKSFTVATVTAGSVDTIPPTTTAVISPAAIDGWHRSDVVVDLEAVDNPGGSGVREVTYALTGAQTGGLTLTGSSAQVAITRDGDTTLTYFAIDNAGNQEIPQQRVVRIDRTGPTITGMPAGACAVWPPNHKLHTLADVRAADAGSGLAANGLVVTATSSEAADGRGDGHTTPDIVIVGGLISVRAERSGLGVGRTYTVTATATDLAGNVTRMVSSCTVPHDQGKGR